MIFTYKSPLRDEPESGTPSPFMRKSFPFAVPSGILIASFFQSRAVIVISHPRAACAMLIGTAQ